MNTRRRIAAAMVLLAGIACLGHVPPLTAQETEEPRRIGLGFNPQEAQPRIAVIEPGSLAFQFPATTSTLTGMGWLGSLARFSASNSTDQPPSSSRTTGSPTTARSGTTTRRHQVS